MFCLQKFSESGVFCLQISLSLRCLSACLAGTHASHTCLHVVRHGPRDKEFESGEFCLQGFSESEVFCLQRCYEFVLFTISMLKIFSELNFCV